MDVAKLTALITTARSQLNSAEFLAAFTPTHLDDEAVQKLEAGCDYLLAHPEVLAAVGVLYDTLLKVWDEFRNDPGQLAAALKNANSAIGG